MEDESVMSELLPPGSLAGLRNLKVSARVTAHQYAQHLAALLATAPDVEALCLHPRDTAACLAADLPTLLRPLQHAKKLRNLMIALTPAGSDHQQMCWLLLAAT